MRSLSIYKLIKIVRIISIAWLNNIIARYLIIIPKGVFVLICLCLNPYLNSLAENKGFNVIK
jgi:hypothetical protein